MGVGGAANGERKKRLTYEDPFITWYNLNYQSALPEKQGKICPYTNHN